jgi:hypothetical protein
VAEYSKIQGKTYSTVGLGAVISRATDAGNFAVLLGATVVMAATVVTVNRLFWRKMYGLASTRYKMDGGLRLYRRCGAKLEYQALPVEQQAALLNWLAERDRVQDSGISLPAAPARSSSIM